MKKQIILEYMEGIEGDFANRTLARKVVDENPELFEGNYKRQVDQARSMIRYIRGANGKKHRKNAMKEFVRDEMKPSEYMKNYMDKGETTAQPPWKLPDHHKKMLVMGDTHFPFHDMDAINSTIDYAIGKGIDGIYLNGDIMDCYKSSNWLKDPRRRDLDEELFMTREFLEGLTGLGVPVYYKLGNHEKRWDTYLLQNAPEMHKVDQFRLWNVLKLEDLGIEVIKDRQRSQFGSLNVIHGHEFGRSFFNPVNPARGLFLRAKTSTLTHHYHQTSAHHENNLNNKQTACFSVGCLCSLEPEYRPYAFTKWNLGFAIVEVEGQMFKVDNHRIVDGRIV